jgi:hypothetical protein
MYSPDNARSGFCNNHSPVHGYCSKRPSHYRTYDDRAYGTYHGNAKAEWAGGHRIGTNPCCDKAPRPDA